MTIKVKPLVWQAIGDDVTYRADSILGFWTRWEGHYLAPEMYGGRAAENPEVAAQADYEARILSAIEAVDPATFCDVRKWEFFPVPMPITSDGKGPATIGKDAVRIEYEVWDSLFVTHASHDNLPDAINEAMFLNGFVDPATIRAEALREAHDAIADYPRVAPDGTEAQHYDEQIEYSQSIILALIDKEQDQ